MIRRGESGKKVFFRWKKAEHFIHPMRDLKELRQEICKYLERKIHVDYDPITRNRWLRWEEARLLTLALRCMLDPGDEVLIPQPSYVSYLPCTVMADGVPVVDSAEI